MPRTRGLAHVNLNVSDLDRSVRFYCAVFGLEIVADSTEVTQRDGQPVELRQTVLSTPGREDLLALTHAASFPVGSAGLNHIGFTFETDEDVRSALDAVSSHGGTIVHQGEREESGIREIFAYVRDPDGYAIELATQAILLATKEARRKQ